MNFPIFPFSAGEVAAEACRHSAGSSEMMTADNFRRAFSCIDLTTLNATDTVSHVASFTQKVNLFEREYPGIPPVAAICVYPNMVGVVKENLAVGVVKVASVAGGFPSSMTFAELKAEEARMAVLQGADEVDIVMPLWAFLGGNEDYCLSEIRKVKMAIGDAHLKVILESGILADPEKIWKASLLSLEAGADFIKTSTGKTAVSATPEAAVVMCHALKYWYDTTGQMRGFKPAGGISSPADALVYMTLVLNILGESWLDNRLFRIGASRLANNLLSEITGRENHHF
ncbi:MAG: deoxyribose-phosphate aldolase [Prolixibacteraceae bacterium]|jgi:deoxyribose-phosphate aldolase|nr:deoxyribose-phosphate aldolase [Prolixibacteraceae bacterium]MDI9562932.1 deoxyribose-phosphate aldolase [Bacteroidota bacterium]NLS99867.1 deoxyribose-phosphate aldolase [Bacteroidales bacterium]OQB80178.1 MAG: Deoxyribose-phosphate aldolase [Bacteroidetes bacterium ADurb.Bin123]HNZ67932.1 deoxyribose-phosphate aldolase [Prolixibacteraceae bacterium]